MCKLSHAVAYILCTYCGVFDIYIAHGVFDIDILPFTWHLIFTFFLSHSMLYFSSFQSILPHVQMLWELVLSGEVSVLLLCDCLVISKIFYFLTVVSISTLSSFMYWCSRA